MSGVHQKSTEGGIASFVGDVLTVLQMVRPCAYEG